MERKNRTLRIPEGEEKRIREALIKRGFTERKVENTLWSLEGQDTYLNMYPSGILLIQGKEAVRVEEEVLSFLNIPPGEVAGCDEAGKGDIFGPLVISCCLLKPETYKEVLRVAPKDSKRMGDEEVLKKFNLLKPLLVRRSIIISPERFNELYEKMGNVNRLLDRAYIRLLEEIKKISSPVRIVVDAYSSLNPFQGKSEVLFVTGAERFVEVSCASIVARAKFLIELKKMGKELGLDIPKGASAIAKELARDLLRRDPRRAAKYIKLSFEL
jgi:ribonuclease HIII